MVSEVSVATTVLMKFARVDDEVASPADLASISALISIEFVVAVPVDDVARLRYTPVMADAGSPGKMFVPSSSGK